MGSSPCPSALAGCVLQGVARRVRWSHARRGNAGEAVRRVSARGRPSLSELVARGIQARADGRLEVVVVAARGGGGSPNRVALHRTRETSFSFSSKKKRNFIFFEKGKGKKSKDVESTGEKG